MDYAQILGVAAGILTSIRFFPQVYLTVKIKETRDLSLWFLILVFFQSLFLIFYGLAVTDKFITIMNISPLVCSLILLIYKFKYK